MPFSSFEHKIKERLQDARVQPTTDVWDKISSRLQAEGGDEGKAAFVLPLFFRKENLKYSVSAAAVVSLLAIGLHYWGSAPESASAQKFAEAHTIEADCQEVSPSTTEEHTHIYIEDKGDERKAAERIPVSEDISFELLAEHEILKQELYPFGKKRAMEIQRVEFHSTERLDPISDSPLPMLAERGNVLSTTRAVAPSNSREKAKTFQPKIKWGLTAMSALQLNAVSESILAREFEDNLVGISSLSSQFQYPNSFSAARAEVELQLSEHLGIETGLGFSSSYQTTSFGSDLSTSVDPALGFNASGTPGNSVALDYSSLGSEVNQLEYNSLDIPLLVNYYMGKGKSHLLLSTGVLYKHLLNNGPDYLVETIAYTNNAPNNVRFVDPVEGNFSFKDLVFLIGRAHYQVKLNSSVALHAGPSLQLGMGPAFSYQNRSSRNPMSLGFELGLRFIPKG